MVAAAAAAVCHRLIGVRAPGGGYVCDDDID